MSKKIRVRRHLSSGHAENYLSPERGGGEGGRVAMAPLEPGTYRLTAEVANPRPDRRASQTRVTSWEAWSRWPKGMLFVVDVNPEFPTLNKIHPQGGLRRLSPHDPAFSALVRALAPVEEKPSDYIVRNGAGLVTHYALGILDRLGVSVERVAEIMREVDDEETEHEQATAPLAEPLVPTCGYCGLRTCQWTGAGFALTCGAPACVEAALVK